MSRNWGYLQASLKSTMDSLNSTLTAFIDKEMDCFQVLSEFFLPVSVVSIICLKNIYKDKIFDMSKVCLSFHRKRFSLPLVLACRVQLEDSWSLPPSLPAYAPHKGQGRLKAECRDWSYLFIYGPNCPPWGGCGVFYSLRRNHTGTVGSPNYHIY